MHPVDHIFILLLFVAQPIIGVIETRRYDTRAKAGIAFDRRRFYRQTALVEWAFLAALGTAWILLERQVADLGIVRPGGPGFWIGAGVVLVMAGVLLHSYRAATQASTTEKARQADALGKLIRYVPQSAADLRRFVGVSVTAGIVEEIVYRGFVIWYLGQYMSPWLAVGASSVVFGLGHSYQGASGALRCGLVGLAFGLCYVGTGSIWLPIIAHILLDILQGATIYRLFDSDHASPEPRPA